MSDLMLRSSVQTQAAVYSVVEYVRRALARLTDEETGQDLVEYGGILIIVAAIVLALVNVGIPGKITTAVGNAVNSVLH